MAFPHGCSLDLLAAPPLVACGELNQVFSKLTFRNPEITIATARELLAPVYYTGAEIILKMSFVYQLGRG